MAGACDSCSFFDSSVRAVSTQEHGEGQPHFTTMLDCRSHSDRIGDSKHQKSDFNRIFQKYYNEIKKNVKGRLQLFVWDLKRSS
jgi:hypothetical protein